MKVKHLTSIHTAALL